MKNQYKIRIVLVDEEGERLIEVLDKMQELHTATMYKNMIH